MEINMLYKKNPSSQNSRPPTHYRTPTILETQSRVHRHRPRLASRSGSTPTTGHRHPKPDTFSRRATWSLRRALDGTGHFSTSARRRGVLKGLGARNDGVVWGMALVGGTNCSWCGLGNKNMGCIGGLMNVGFWRA